MAAIHAKNTLHAIWRQNIVNNLTAKKWVEQEKLQSQQPIYKKNINNNNFRPQERQGRIRNFI